MEQTLPQISSIKPEEPAIGGATLEIRGLASGLERPRCH